MSQNAQSVFTRQQPKPRMRQQRNNSVAPAADGTDTADEAQLSIAPDEDEPTFDSFISDPDPEPVSGPQDEQDPPAKGEQATPAGTQAKDKPAPAAKAEAETAKSEDQGTLEKDAPTNAATVPEAAEPATGTPEGPAASDEPAQAEPEPTSAPAPAKKAIKSPVKQPASTGRAPAPTAVKASGTALAVINPDGSVTVDPGTHLVDLREVAAQGDPHALVDMLGALRDVTDSDLRQRVTAEISTAITTAALRN